MKKTIQINIAGSVFFIDEDAYLQLDNYLETIKVYLNNNEDCDEIIHDIEMRIAELLLEKQTTSNQAINIQHIHEVIKTMGQPEDYRMHDENNEEEVKSANWNTRKFYRDIDDRFVGGVASGMAHYLGIEPIWMRLIWVFLSLSIVFKIKLVYINFGGAFFIYLLLWILVPAARTTSQKLQMKGKPANLSNIEKSLRKEFENVKKTNFQATSANFFDWLLRVFKFFLKIFVMILGISLLMSSLVISLVLIINMFINYGYFNLFGLELPHYSTHWVYHIAKHLSIIIPFLLLFLLSLYIINPKKKTIGRQSLGSIIVIWIIAISVLSYFHIATQPQKQLTGSFIEKQDINLQAQDTLKIKLKQASVPYIIPSNKKYSLKKDNTGNYFIYGRQIDLCINPTDNEKASLFIEKSIEDNDRDSAASQAEEIEFYYQIEGNNIELENYFLIKNSKESKKASVKISINLPENTIFIVEEEVLSQFTHNNCTFTFSPKEAQHIVDSKIICLNCTDKTTSDPSKISDWEDRVEKAFKTF